MTPINHDLIRSTLATADSFQLAAATLGISEPRLAELMADRDLRKMLDDDALEMYHEFARRLQRSCDHALGVLRRAIDPGEGERPTKEQIVAARAILTSSKDVLAHFELDVKLGDLRERVEKLQ